jgi:hypothetical protein
MGSMSIKNEQGNIEKSPYLKVLYRANGNINRRRELKVFGPGGTPHEADTLSLQYLSEFTVQIVGANGWFVGSKDAGQYTYDD